MLSDVDEADYKMKEGRKEAAATCRNLAEDPTRFVLRGEEPTPLETRPYRVSESTAGGVQSCNMPKGPPIKYVRKKLGFFVPPVRIQS